MPQFKRCLMFLADGARPDVLRAEMDKGNLPNLSRYLAEGGTHETALTVFPSTTGPAYLPYLTGCYPGTCNVPGIRWFDKAHYAKHGWSYRSFRSYVGLETFLMNRDIRPEIKSAFEIIPESVSIFNMINRGIKEHHNKTKFSRIWYIYYGHCTDHWAFVDEAATKKLIAALDEGLEFAFTVFPAIDEYSHRSSPFHPRTIQAYHELDRHVGSIVQTLEKKGMLEETLMILVADHGLSDTHTHFDIGPYMEEKGIKTFFYTQILKRNFSAASMISGNGMAHLYFKGESEWKERTTYEELSHSGLLLDELRLRPEIALVACRGADDSIHLLTEKGHGSFQFKAGKIEYQWSHDEPLGLNLPNPETHLKSFSLDSSLDATFNSHYPDVFMQLLQIYRSPRSGDVILSANSGYDLRKRFENPEHKASHGALCPEHMKIPFLMNYPLKQQSERATPLIRSVDIFPTMLKLTGREAPEGIDGVSLI